MKIKNKIMTLGLAAISAVAMSSCSDFLDEGPKTSLPEDIIYSDTAYVESNVQTLYKNWRGLFTDRYLWEQMVGTDEIQSGAYQALKEDGGRRGSLDKYDALLTSELSYVVEQWENRWPTVSEAAKIVNSLGKLNLDEDKKVAGLYGEASFIRGGLMMELAMLYGRIPIIDVSRQDELGYGRQPLKDVWQFIINDLKNAAQYCPETNNPGRATRYAASMMLGYAYMAAPEETGLRDFSLAKDALETVVKGPFKLVAYYDLWDYSITNTSESILEWQFNNVYPDCNSVQFQIGSRAVQSYFGDGCYYSGYDHAVPSQWAYSNVEDGEYGKTATYARKSLYATTSHTTDRHLRSTTSCGRSLATTTTSCCRISRSMKTSAPTLTQVLASTTSGTQARTSRSCALPTPFCSTPSVSTNWDRRARPLSR